MDETRTHLTKTMRILLAFACVFCLYTSPITSQSIRLVRTDVDSGRAGFVTATQMFGVDVIVSGVKNCTGVSFELQYQGSRHIVFSNWKARELGKKGTFAYDLSDTTSGTGSVHIGALSGVAATDPGITNPNAIHLDFVVKPSAPNGTPVSFSFVHAQAVTSDSGGRIVNLSSTPYNVVVHGFVKVFPGDADNNGIVDSRDATTVGSFLKQGSGSSNVRGYKREPSSTLWLAQTALVWDSSKATYADCDGSGDVTLSDNLVVQINFGLLHSITKKKDDIQTVRNSRFAASLARVPISILSPVDLLGAAFELQLSNSNSRVVGFEVSDAYPEARVSFFKADPITSQVYLVLGSENSKNILKSGVIGSLIFERDPSTYTVKEALGATSNGRIFPLGILSDVRQDLTEDESPVYYNELNHQLTVKDGFQKLSIYSLLGQKCDEFVGPNNSTTICLEQLKPGMYLVVLENGQPSTYSTLRIVR